MGGASWGGQGGGEGLKPGSGSLGHAIGELGEGHRGSGVQLAGGLGGDLAGHMNADVVCDATVNVLAHLQGFSRG